MIYLNNCDNLVKNGFLIRILLTIISLPLIDRNFKYLLIIIPIILGILDGLDNVFINYEIVKRKYNFIFNSGSNCTIINRYYHLTDKILDILSYIIFYIYFYDKLKDKLLEFFIIYRLIGIINYIITGNKNNIIIFFDFVKEYMIYKFFFKNNYYLLIILIICKIYFEYWFHNFHNKF